jgi:hypothetical protein
MSSIAPAAGVKKSQEPEHITQAKAVSAICLDIATRLDNKIEPIFAAIRTNPRNYSSHGFAAMASDIVRPYRKELREKVSAVKGPLLYFPEVKKLQDRFSGLGDVMSRVHEQVNGNLSRTNTGSLSDSSEPSQC